ncbi:MAG: ATP-binding protein [Actinomycetota bacterium]
MERGELIERLRSLVILDRLDDAQFEWLADRAEVLEVEAGATLFDRGAEWPGLFVLIEGALEIIRDLSGTPTVMATNSTPGVWAGAIPYADDGVSEVTVRCPEPSLVLHLSNDGFVELVQEGIPIFHHLLRGIRDGTLRFTQRISGEERLASLGRLSAGLAHELNNPAAAAQRSAARLPSAIWDLQAAAVGIVVAAGPSEGLRSRLEAVETDLLQHAAEAAPLAPLERSDREDEILDALEDAGVVGGDDLVEALVDAGVDADWLERQVDAVSEVEPGPLLAWIGRIAEVRQLIGEVELSAGRIADLVGSIKAYSYMDREGGGRLDLHTGLDATLAVLRHKLRGGIEVVRDYDTELPELEGHAGELNQVWTNLVDNAWDAMDGSGTLTIRTRREPAGAYARIEIIDDGPGVPADRRPHVFDPFFTTKGVGEGSGLGLDIVRRIVVDGHGGTVHVDDAPGGGAAFVVRLPLSEQHDPAL